MTSRTTKKYAPEVRARAVRMVLDHKKDLVSRWATVESIAGKRQQWPMCEDLTRILAVALGAPLEGACGGPGPMLAIQVLPFVF